MVSRAVVGSTLLSLVVATAASAAGSAKRPLKDRREAPAAPADDKLRRYLEERLDRSPGRTAEDAAATCPPDPYEEDDGSTSTRPIALDECQDRNHCEDATDWLSFTAVPGTRYSVETCNLGAASDTVVWVYDPGLNPVAIDDDGGSCDTLASAASFLALTAGPYLIEVQQLDGIGAPDREYQVCVRPGCATTDVHEEDDTPAKARRIAAGECQDRNHCDDTTDWLSLAVVSGETYTVRACNIGAGADTAIEVLDSAQNFVTFDSDRGGCDPLAAGVAFTATETAGWFVAVHSSSGAGREREYQVCVDRGCTLADASEDDDVPAQAVAMIPGECRVQNHCDDGADWLALDALAGAAYDIQTCNFAFPGDTRVRVYDPAMALVAEDDNGGSCDPLSSSVRFTAAQAGRHFVELTQADGGSGPGRDYYLCLDGGCVGTDAFEPDDSAAAAGAIAAGACQDRNHCDDGADWLRFPVTDGETYTITACNTGANGDTVLELYDTGLNLIEWGFDGGPCDPLAAAIAFTAYETGTWRVKVGQGDGSFGDERGYRICLERGCTLSDPYEEDDLPAQAAAIAVGECQGHSHCDDAADWLTFAAAAGAAYRVETCTGADTLIRVYDPAQVPVGQNDDGGPCGGGASSLLFTAAVAGDYTVEVVPADGGTGPGRDYYVCLEGGCAGADAFEPDDGAGAARPIAPGACQDHDHCDDGADWLSFAVTAGEVYTAHTCGQGLRSDSRLVLHDSGLNPLAADEDGGICGVPGSAALAFTATETASWYLEVGSFFDGIGDEREYRVCLERGCLIGDGYEDDDDASRATPVALGDCQYRQHCDDASDWLAVDLVAGQTVQAATCNFGLRSDTLVRVHDPSLTLVASDDNGGTCDPLAAAVTFVAAASGTHYVEVVQADGAAGPDREYDICVREVCPAADAYEDDDDPGAARPLAVDECQVHDHCDDQTDWLELAVAAGQSYIIETCHQGARGDTYLVLFDSAINFVGFDDDGGTCGGGAARIAFTASETANWFAEVGQNDGTGPGRDYQVCLRRDGLARLLRDATMTDIDPPAPARHLVLPLDPAGDRYLDSFPSGSEDGDPVVPDDTRPLIFYGIEAPARLSLVKSGDRVRVYF